MKNALATIGALALIVGVIAAGVGISMLSRGFSAQDEPSAIEAQLARLMRRGATPLQVRDLKNPIASTEAVLAEGRHHWADHCATCHANDGSGDSPIGKHLYPRAPDMRVAPTQGLTDGELYSIIQGGIRLTGMPAWGKAGDERDHDSWALVAFIRHLPNATPQELEQMKQLNPKSVDEWREELEEEQFLRGEDAPEPNSPKGHHP